MTAYLSVKEVCAILKVCKKTLLKMCAKNEIAYYPMRGGFQHQLRR